MKKLIIIALILLVIFSAMFMVAEHYGYADPEAALKWLEEYSQNTTGKFSLALIIIGLLVIDLLLPVPSSIVMVFSGIFFGIFWGSVISFTGAIIAALTGFYLCRLGGQKYFDKLCGTEEAEGIKKWFEQYGILAIIISRPIPMLTEILSCLAGLSHLRSAPFIAASVIGTLPICIIYAYAGSCGKKDAPLITVAVSVLIPAIGWVITRYLKRSKY